MPTTKKFEKAWIARSKSDVACCVQKAGSLLVRIATEDSVKDVDAIRVAVGQAHINYLAYSYRTTLGHNDGTLFPTHLRRAIFDSNVGPSRDWYEAFQKVFRVFASWVPEYDKTYYLGKTQSAVIGN